MKTRTLGHAVCVLSLLLMACAPKPQSPDTAPAPSARNTAPVLLTPDAHDIHSHAEPAVARVQHVALDLAVDMAAHVLTGTAALDVEVSTNGALLTLDTRDLVIDRVDNGKGTALKWTQGATDPILGAALRVELGADRHVVIHYKTSPTAAALQWLAPAQTAGGKLPYLFSQGEAIQTRTWIPTQDSPGIRQTWSARIVAPADLKVVMSATMLGEDTSQSIAGTRVWRFEMNEPVAPYLIAIGIGDIAFQALGDRTGVYTEPSVLPAAASELADVELMVKAAESLYGPYRWGRYDLLVLPPSFPFGGMENPRLTFATPTILAGDKSLVSLVAHELAHSWSGNLVTNATWADFWLNEGFTVYFENRIMERVYGPARAAMLADLEWDELQAGIVEVGGMKSPDTRLHIDLAGRDPDDGVTDIAYNKGATFLRTIEAAVGRARWDAFLRDYFDRHAFQPQTTAGFLVDLRANLIKGDKALEDGIGIDEWAYGTGLPANAVHVRSKELEAVTIASKNFATRGAGDLDASQWSTPERVRFLNRLPRKLPAEKLVSLRKLLVLDSQRNSEVRFAWLRIAIANRYDVAMPQLDDFLGSMGRRKFVLPLFTDLMAQGEWGKALAQRIYVKTRPGYHPLTVGSVDKVMNPSPK
jgi:leukotriene-A4 hydrolase